jgi:hypothetical protein
VYCAIPYRDHIFKANATSCQVYFTAVHIAKVLEAILILVKKRKRPVTERSITKVKVRKNW